MLQPARPVSMLLPKSEASWKKSHDKADNVQSSIPKQLVNSQTDYSWLKNLTAVDPVSYFCHTVIKQKRAKSPHR